eukprot:9470876-Pyramimonas_sp.AAC.1
MAGAQSQVGLDFSAISGPKAALITGGAINFDQPDGYAYNHCEDSSINISLHGLEARVIAAQYVVEYTGVRSNSNDPDRLRLSGETEHEAPPIVTNKVAGNWMALVQQMQLGLRIIRILAIVRETMSSFISDGHFVGCLVRIIRPARENTDP